MKTIVNKHLIINIIFGTGIFAVNLKTLEVGQCKERVFHLNKTIITIII